MIFTLRCISKGLVLVSVKLSFNRKDISVGSRNTIRRAERQLLHERVKCINSIFQDNGGSIASSMTRLFSMVTDPTVQEQCKEFIDKVREVRFNKVRDRQVVMFFRLLNRNNFK